MIGVSKTFGGSSILSSPALKSFETVDFTGVQGSFYFYIISGKYSGMKLHIWIRAMRVCKKILGVWTRKRVVTPKKSERSRRIGCREVKKPSLHPILCTERMRRAALATGKNQLAKWYNLPIKHESDVAVVCKRWGLIQIVKFILRNANPKRDLFFHFWIQTINIVKRNFWCDKIRMRFIKNCLWEYGRQKKIIFCATGILSVRVFWMSSLY